MIDKVLAKPLLKLTDVSLQIHGTPILKRINLELLAGKVLGIIGESGSGKSMTAFSILQLLPEGSDLSGVIEFDGHTLTDMQETRLCELRGNAIGMVFQEPMTALNPVQSIGQQVAESIRLHQAVSKKMAWQQAAVVLERVGLPNDEFPLSRFPHELSGGQRQRVVIAIAVALKPQLLIADEPTTALDVTTQSEILHLLKKLVQEENMALIFITHDLAVVADVADDIAIMRDGEVLESGSTERVFRELSHPYSQALLGASLHVPERISASIAPAPLLDVKDLVCEYPMPRQRLFGLKPVFRAVNKISFTIAPGESVGLVGESGCGKSTLSRALLGILPVQGGRVMLAGHSIHTSQALTHEVRRKMQVVFQDPYSSFNPRHKVARLIAEPLFVLQQTPTRAQQKTMVLESLQRVGLEAQDADKYIHEFSGGQRQRIAIARAIINKPELIVLDEAVSALDVSVRAQILDLLAALANDHGLSYLFISHDLSVVRNITDRVLVMQHGEIVERGDTKTVFDSPQNSYTRALLAAVPRLSDSIAAQAAGFK